MPRYTTSTGVTVECSEETAGRALRLGLTKSSSSRKAPAKKAATKSETKSGDE